MLRLQRKSEIWGTGWFLSVAVVLSFALASLMMAGVDTGDRYDLLIAPQLPAADQLVMVVRVPAPQVSFLETVR